MKVGIIALMFCFGVIAYGQDNYPKVSFDMGYNNQFVKMKTFNQYFIDSNFIKFSGIDETFKQLHNFNLAFRVRPKSIYDIGLLIGFQDGFIVDKPTLKGLDDNLNLFFTEGYSKLSVQSLNIGLVNTFYIDRFFEFQSEINILNRIDFGIDLLIGYSLTSVTNEFHNTTVDPISISLADWFTNDFYSKIGISVEYLLFSETISCTIGFRTGYQFLKTNTMADRLEDEYIKMPYVEPINLDLSGLFYGVYLKIGK